MMNIFFALAITAAPPGAPTPQEVRAMDEKLRLRERFGPMDLDTIPPDLPYDILHYAIDIEIDTAGDSIAAARCDVEFQVVNDTMTALRLDFVDSVTTDIVGLTVDSVLLDGSPVSWAMTGADSARDMVIPLGSVFQGQVDTASVFYHGIPTHPSGVISNGGLNINDTICYVDDEPWGARHWFPCVDIPSDKATSEMTVRVPSGWRVVSNGVLTDSSLSGPVWMFHWTNYTHQIATYLMVFAAYDYITLRDTFVWGADTLPVYHYVSHADSDSAAVEFALVPEMLAAYSTRYGTYPFMDQKYSQVQVDELGGAMENQTNTFFGFGIPGTQGTAWVQAHELSHHWWGDYVTCGTWPDLWLNEGFATFSEAAWWEWYQGKDMYQYWIDSVRMHIYLKYATYPPIPIYNPGQDLGSLFSVEVYDKAGCVLHSLRRITEYLLGGDTLAFWNALQYYRSNHTEGYALTKDFTQEYQAHTGLDLDWFFNEWLYRPGHPIYDVGWETHDLGSGSWRVDLQILQTQSHDYGVPSFKMPVPLLFKAATGDTTVVVWDSVDTQFFSIYLDREPTDLVFDPGNWVIDSHIVHLGVDELSLHPENKVLSLGPNPARDRFLVEFIVPSRSSAELVLYSSDGRLVRRASRDAFRGVNILEVSTRDLPSGVYIADFRLDRNSLLKTKVVKP